MKCESQVRAGLYLLLAALLREAPDERLLSQLGNLEVGEEDSDLAQALGSLKQIAPTVHPVELEREFHALFIGVTRGELMPYASWYLSGYLHERPLAWIRKDLRRLGIERSCETCEPEDHIAFLCESMALLALQAEESQERFYRCHLKPWVDRFFADLTQADAARFYRVVGRLGCVFVARENRYFDA